MKKIVVVTLSLLSLLLWRELKAADTLELSRCWELGIQNYPLAKQKGLLDESLAIRLKTLTVASYFPVINIKAEASYQSDVTHIDNVPGLPFNIESISKDQYQATINIQQNIFDGNVSHANSTVEKYNTEEQKQMNDADILSMKQQIQQVYFTGLLHQNYGEIFKTTLETLDERINTARSALRNGMATQRDVSLLEVERLKTEKQIAEAHINRVACIRMLEELTGSEFSQNSIFRMPNVEPIRETALENLRPEMHAFDTRINRLIANKSILNTQITPTVQIFGTAGYGRPGYNMLSNNFDPFFMVGVRIIWIPWDGNVIKREKKNLDLQAKIVANQKAAFDENTRTTAWNKRYEIQKQEELLKQDQEIVKLRGQIVAESVSQLHNGTITMSDYISDLNAETSSRLSVETSKIQVMRARLEYLLTLGHDQK
jgi:outer membrane protein TolC